MKHAVLFWLRSLYQYYYPCNLVKQVKSIGKFENTLLVLFVLIKVNAAAF